jgi:hypothetical protein
MTLRKIRLELARDREFPTGSSARGYAFVAPLDKDGHIDVEAWKKHRRDCTVRRFWENEDEFHGHLLHTQGGRWVFHYDLDSEPEPDEPGYHFESHRFVTGEYVSITEHDGVLRTFRIVSVS